MSWNLTTLKVAISNLQFLCPFFVQAYLYKKKLQLCLHPSEFKKVECAQISHDDKICSAKIGQVFPEIKLFRSLQRANAMYLLLGKKIFTRASMTMGMRGTDHYQFAFVNLRASTSCQAK